ncbi:MAG: glycosyltransferase family 39 protein, partial [Gemmatimonadota bacterium]|nr:glycosyltransferase family 39 protein [Gemmatimonadota bacterium]
MSARLRGAPAWLPTALLVAVAVVAAWTRVLQARESLWLDELHTAWVAMGSWGEVAARSMAGNQSAPFFALEWALVHTLGASELVLRLPSLVAGVALVGALYTLARAWTGSAWIGLVTAWLAAADPQAIYYGTEARPYALVQLLGVLHVALFAELVRRPTVAKRVASVVGAAVLFHLHYTTALVFGGEVAWYAWARLRGRVGYRLRDAAIDATIAVALMAPAVAVLRLLAARRHNWELFVDQRPPWIAILMLPWAATALVATAAVSVWRRVRRATPAAGRDRGDVVRCLLCWLVVPVALAWVSTAV